MLASQHFIDSGRVASVKLQSADIFKCFITNGNAQTLDTTCATQKKK